jgi:hypothetical protein
MARVLTSLVDPCGRVSLPGFYDNVRSLEREEEAIYDEIIRRCQGFAERRFAPPRVASFRVVLQESQLEARQKFTLFGSPNVFGRPVSWLAPVGSQHGW